MFVGRIKGVVSLTGFSDRRMYGLLLGPYADSCETTFLGSLMQAYRPWIRLPVPFNEVRLRSCHYGLLPSTITCNTVLDVHRATELD